MYESTGQRRLVGVSQQYELRVLLMTEIFLFLLWNTEKIQSWFRLEALNHVCKESSDQAKANNINMGCWRGNRDKLVVLVCYFPIK